MSARPDYPMVVVAGTTVPSCVLCGTSIPAVGSHTCGAVVAVNNYALHCAACGTSFGYGMEHRCRTPLSAIGANPSTCASALDAFSDPFAAEEAPEPEPRAPLPYVDRFTLADQLARIAERLDRLEALLAPYPLSGGASAPPLPEGTP